MGPAGHVLNISKRVGCIREEMRAVSPSSRVINLCCFADSDNIQSNRPLSFYVIGDHQEGHSPRKWSKGSCYEGCRQVNNL